jgi:LysM repeat protein
LGSFEPLETIEPLEPIESISGAQTVAVAGSGFQNYTVKQGDSLWSIAKRYDVSVNELYAANGLNKNSVIRVGQQVQIPVEGGTATVSVGTPDTYQPSGFDQATTTYTVQRGDNLSRIAQRYDTTVRALKAANGKSSDMIRVGESLVVPAVSAAAGAAPMSATPTPAPATTRLVAASSGATRTHTVKAGEFPGKIARQYGMTTNELLAMNSITDPRKLRVGQKLTVSGSGSAANVDSQVETVAATGPSQPVTIVPSRPRVTTGQSEIRVIEADPLLESEFSQPLRAPNPNDVFNNAVEIPVIRLEE